MSTQPYDLVIVGGGLVGASLACALQRTPLRIAVLEGVAPEAPAQPSYDDRSTALAPSTVRLFQAVGLWEALRGAATPIREIHVSEQGRFGFTRMGAAEEGLDALGYVISNRRLGEVLPARMREQANVEVLCPAQVEGLERQSEAVALTVGTEQGVRSLAARLVVAADGARSHTRDCLGIAVRERDYGQVAVIANLTPEREHRGRAFERFTPDGPMALLPLDGGRCALIWSVQAARAEAVLALSDADFLAEVQARFGHRLGRLLKVGARSRYPLTMISAREVTAERAVILGNAAHTLHPVAGQGFNLALRDVAWLAELLHEAALAGGDPGRAELLARYAQGRVHDYRRVGGFTDLLVRVFSNRLPGLTLARNLGLVGLDLFPAAKRGFLGYAMGRSGYQPRLSRGVPLPEGAE